MVEIDEANVGKRKQSNRGRLVDGTLVLGLIEIVIDEPRFRIIVECPTY